MLRHAMIILAIVLVIENSGLSTVPLPAAVIAAEITVRAPITLAAASIARPVAVLAVTATVSADCVAESTGTRAAMCGSHCGAG
jgi:hypothetical protein